VTDNNGNEIIKCVRPFHFGRRGGLFFCCCGDFCFQVLQVHAGAASANPGAYLGYVRENYSFFVPVLSIFDADDNEIYRIVGECCGCANYSFNIFDQAHLNSDNDADSCGVIQRRWAGISKELFGDADNFFVTFPVSATPAHRALFLGATFLIDFLYFARKNNNQGDILGG